MSEQERKLVDGQGAKRIAKMARNTSIFNITFALIVKFTTMLLILLGVLPEAMMIVADKEKMLILSGTGEVIEPQDDVCAIGSGGNYALAAAKALMQNTKLDAKEIAKKALLIASEICVFTNSNLVIEEV